MIQPLNTRVIVEGQPGIVVDHEPASRVGDHSRHVVRLDNGSLVSTDADLVQAVDQAPPTGTVVLEPAAPLALEPASDDVGTSEPAGE